MVVAVVEMKMEETGEEETYGVIPVPPAMRQM